MDIFKFLFPQQCIICSKVGHCICNSCIKKLPRCLPSCPVCGLLSNDYLIHSKHRSTLCYGYTGWCIPNSLKVRLDSNIEKGLYSTHLFLLEDLIHYLKLKDRISFSDILPIYSERKDIMRLNTALAKSLSKDRGSNTLLLIGNSWEDEGVKVSIEKGPLKKKSSYSVLTLFRYFTP